MSEGPNKRLWARMDLVAPHILPGRPVAEISAASGVPLAEAYDLVQRIAHHAFALAKKDGRVLKATECSDCGKGGRIHAHHPDYTKPLDVEWLCPKCHSSRHPKRGRRLLAQLAQQVTA